MKRRYKCKFCKGGRNSDLLPCEDCGGSGVVEVYFCNKCGQEIEIGDEEEEEICEICVEKK